MKFDAASYVRHGGNEALRKARARYEADPEGGLLPYATACYNLRSKKLLELRGPLCQHVQRLMLLRDAEERPETPDPEILERVSAWLTWMSRQKKLCEETRGDLRELATFACEQGISFMYTDKELRRHARGVPEQHPRSHTLPLLLLTRTALFLEEHDVESACECLEEAEAEAQTITDPKQRTRVYRKLGLLYRKMGDFRKGFTFGMKACFIPEVPRTLRVRGMIALLGIAR